MKSPKSATDPDVDGNGGDGNGSVVLGLIGHPNVGKSSMVNHLMGEKVVSVKAWSGFSAIGGAERSTNCCWAGVISAEIFKVYPPKNSKWHMGNALPTDGDFNGKTIDK